MVDKTKLPPQRPAISILQRSDGPIYKRTAGYESGVRRHTTNAILVCLTLPVPEPPVQQ